MLVLDVNHKKGINKNSLVYLMINISVLSTVILQFFLETDMYSPARIILYVIFLVSFFTVLSINFKVIKNKFFSFYLIAIYLTAVLTLLISFFKGELILGTFFMFTLPGILMYMGYVSNISDVQISKIIKRYMVLVTLLGLFVIFYYGEGFRITTLYFFDSKNQVGPFLASIATVALLYVLSSKKEVELALNKHFLIIIFIINVASLLALRNRSGLVALAVCFFVYLLSKIKFKKLFNKNILLLPLVLVLSLGVLIATNVLKYILNIVSESFFTNYNVSDLDSLSAGRFDVYIAVIDYLKISPFFGELQYQSYITEIPHNFLLNLWLEYGLFGMFSVAAGYISLWVYVIYKLLFKREFAIALYLLLFMLVISVFEYTYPYSPLTTVALTWFLLGVYLSGKKSSSRTMQVS